MTQPVIKLDDNQLAAVDMACSRRRLSVITGGAGTGKTTLIREIANRLRASGDDVRLCAFAGKAAARLREATGHYASTIHKLLMYQGDRFALRDLRGVTVIIDEASMVRSDLLAEIVRRQQRGLFWSATRRSCRRSGLDSLSTTFLRSCRIWRTISRPATGRPKRYIGRRP